MGITIKRNTHTIILLLVLIVSLWLVSNTAGQKTERGDLEAGWYKLENHQEMYYGGAKGSYVIFTLCDAKYGNIIYTIKAGNDKSSQVIQGGCKKGSREYKNLKGQKVPG